MLVVERRALGAADIVRRFSRLKAVVLGDALLDLYCEGRAERLCREAPVPVVRKTDEVAVPGGAANAAANLAAMGADVTFITIVGDDHAAVTLCDTLRSGGIDDALVLRDPSLSTLQKLRVVADGQYVVRFDSGDTYRPAAAVRGRLHEAVDEALARCDVVVISDYSYGAIDDELIRMLGARRKPLVVDAKDLRRYASVHPTLVTPNQSEAEGLLGGGGRAFSSLPELAQRTREVVRAEFAAVTLADDGVLLAGPDETIHVPAHRVHRAHDIGAGDSFAAAAALALAAGAEPADAVRIAVEAGCIAVTKSRTAVVQHQELLQRVSLGEVGVSNDVEALCRELDEERRQGRRIVFTNGVFDILHAGHVHFLRQARSLGDILVVGINSDASTRRLKGDQRPVNPERDRLALVAALDSVDHAVIFDQDTPDALIRAIRPHLHVKGGDYADTPLAEARTVEDVGGRTIILPLYQSESTTRVIERIVALNGTT